MNAKSTEPWQVRGKLGTTAWSLLAAARAKSVGQTHSENTPTGTAGSEEKTLREREEERWKIRFVPTR
jgi:hypothetical protein